MLFYVPYLDMPIFTTTKKSCNLYISAGNSIAKKNLCGHIFDCLVGCLCGCQCLVFFLCLLLLLSLWLYLCHHPVSTPLKKGIYILLFKVKFQTLKKAISEIDIHISRWQLKY